MTEAIRVDAHHHIWDLRARRYTWLEPPANASIHRSFSFGDLTPLCAAAGIDRSVLVQTIHDEAETREFLAAADASALAAGVVGWTDLTSPVIRDRLAELREAPGGDLLVGVRHGVQGEDADWLDQPDVRRGLAALADAGLPYDLLITPKHLDSAVATVRAIPELTFVIDHLAKPPIRTGEIGPWEQQMRALAAEPNTCCKLSGMVTEADWDSWTVEDLRPYADVVLDAFGPARVMFGSDWPVCLLAAPYADVAAAARELTSHLSAAEQADVFGGAAARAYRLRLG
jgi:L-fuconolactonase